MKIDHVSLLRHCIHLLFSHVAQFDGYIARNYPNQRSELGTFLDPMADKLLVATLFATLTYVHLIPG